MTISKTTPSEQTGIKLTDDEALFIWDCLDMFLDYVPEHRGKREFVVKIMEKLDACRC